MPWLKDKLKGIRQKSVMKKANKVMFEANPVQSESSPLRAIKTSNPTSASDSPARSDHGEIDEEGDPDSPSTAEYIYSGLMPSPIKRGPEREASYEKHTLEDGAFALLRPGEELDTSRESSLAGDDDGYDDKQMYMSIGGTSTLTFNDIGGMATINLEKFLAKENEALGGMEGACRDLSLVGKAIVGSKMCVVGSMPPNCKACKFMWFRRKFDPATGKKSYEKIVGAQTPHYIPKPEDVGCLLRVVIAGVLSDGKRGPVSLVFGGPVVASAAATRTKSHRRTKSAETRELFRSLAPVQENVAPLERDTSKIGVARPTTTQEIIKARGKHRSTQSVSAAMSPATTPGLFETLNLQVRTTGEATEHYATIGGGLFREREAYATLSGGSAAIYNSLGGAVSRAASMQQRSTPGHRRSPTDSFATVGGAYMRQSQSLKMAALATSPARGIAPAGSPAFATVGGAASRSPIQHVRSPTEDLSRRFEAEMQVTMIMNKPQPDARRSDWSTNTGIGRRSVDKADEEELETVSIAVTLPNDLAPSSRASPAGTAVASPANAGAGVLSPLAPGGPTPPPMLLDLPAPLMGS
eukprot:jgi/Mesvir1/11701/Mv00091-RA.1